MASVTLRSGRMVELHEPTFLEELHIVAQGADDLEKLMLLKMALIAPSVEAVGPELMLEGSPLSRDDGRALAIAVGKVWDGRPEEQEAPFGNGSASPSTASAAQSSNSTS